MLQLLTLNPGAPAAVMLNRDATPNPGISSALPVSTSRRWDRNFSSRLHFARRLENQTFHNVQMTSHEHLHCSQSVEGPRFGMNGFEKFRLFAMKYSHLNTGF